MRKFLASVVALAFVAAVAHATEFLPSGPATFQIDAVTQVSYWHLVSSKTNKTATVTNLTFFDSETVSSTPFVTSNLLALLENSFNTNLSAGSQISFRYGRFVVLDKTGTNVILDPSAVLTITNNEFVASEKQTEIQTINQKGSSYSGNNSQKVMSDVTINYDDTSVSPADGTNSTFQLRGLLVQKTSANLKTGFTKVSYEFQVNGSGSVHGVTNVLSGTIKENAAGAPPPF